MDKELQRQKIAEACGWKKGAAAMRAFTGEAWFHNEDSSKAFYSPPNYLGSLDAMNQAEKALIRGHYDMEYRETLERVCGEGYGAIIYASAPQRARAFLKTLNLWVEDDTK